MQISRKGFNQLVEDAIAALPPDYARWLDKVPVIVEDRPRPADLYGTDSADSDLLGLYNGAAQDEHSGELPPRVMLYRIPLMEACSSREQLAEEIRKTLLHELGHHAGLDEEDLDRHGLGAVEDDDDIEWDVEEDES